MELKTRDGKLTSYGLACGYVEKWRTIGTRDITVTLWKEGGVYHVRSHNFTSQRRLAWRSFHKLTNARREFSTQKRQVRQGILF